MFTQAFIQVQIKENIKLRVTGLCEGNSPVAGEFPAQRASNAGNVSIWWRHHGMILRKTVRVSHLPVANTGNIIVVALGLALQDAP